MQYADYAAWQRERLAGPALETQLALLARPRWPGCRALELPTDRPRPAVQPSAGGGRHRFTARRRTLTDGLRPARPRRTGATLFMMLLAAFQALLRRYSGQDGPRGRHAGRRPRPRRAGGADRPLRQHAGAARRPRRRTRRFRELLGAGCGDARSARLRPPGPAVRAAGRGAAAGRATSSRPPLFQVLFALQNYAARGGRRPAGPELSRRRRGRPAAPSFDLTLYASARPADGLRGCVEYSTDLFDAATVARLAGACETLLRAAVAATRTRRSSSLALLGAGRADRCWRRLPDGRAGTTGPAAAAYPDRRHAARARSPTQAAPRPRTPIAVGLRTARRARPTRELDAARPTALAAPAARAGRRARTSLVGVCARAARSSWWWRCSASSRPAAPTCRSTPSYPADRLAFMLADAAAPVRADRRSTCATVLPDGRRDRARPGRRRRALGRPAAPPTRRRPPVRATWPTSSTPPARPAGPRA